MLFFVREEQGPVEQLVLFRTASFALLFDLSCFLRLNSKKIFVVSALNTSLTIQRNA